MNDYRDFEPEVKPSGSRQARTLPGGISLPMAAMVLLGVMLLTVLWLFFGPTDSAAPPGLATATPKAATTAAATAPPVTATVSSAGIVTAPVSSAPTTSLPGGAISTPPPAADGDTGAMSSAALGEGVFARVSNTDGMGIRMRFGPGFDTASIRILDEGLIVKVTRSGAEMAGGESWWRVQDDQGNIGWVSGQYLQPVAAPAMWSPPEASPTFPVGVATP